MWEDDARHVAEAMVRDLAGRPEPDWSSAARPPAARVIDCVLSLRRNYKSVVLPRVECFCREHPGVTSCADLVHAIGNAPSPRDYMRRVLRIDSPTKSKTLLGVAEYLVDIQQRFEGTTEEDRLRAWANWARPGDYLMLGVSGFGLAGFQYLRMLFGADTAKPDVHIIRYVSKVLGRQVSDIHALYILERAAVLAGQSLRRLDGLVWERGAGW